MLVKIRKEVHIWNDTISYDQALSFQHAEFHLILEENGDGATSEIFIRFIERYLENKF